MAEIQFQCPMCKQSVEVPEELANQLIDCPKCKGIIDVAAARHPPQAEALLTSQLPQPKKKGVGVLGNWLLVFLRRSRPLVTQLIERVKDRKTAALVQQIQQHQLVIQTALLDADQKMAQMERAYAKAIAELNETNSEVAV